MTIFSQMPQPIESEAPQGGIQPLGVPQGDPRQGDPRLFIAPKPEIPYPLPSSWISKTSELYVLLDYYYPDMEAVLNLKPDGVLVYYVRSEEREVMPIAEFLERVNTGSFTRIKDI